MAQNSLTEGIYLQGKVWEKGIEHPCHIPPSHSSQTSNMCTTQNLFEPHPLGF